MEKHPLLFRYPGGKFYALDVLRGFWSQVVHDEYREPFVGGGSVFFNKPKSKKNWLNDIDDELIITYRVISNKKERPRLLKKLQAQEASKSHWKKIFASHPSSDFEKAFKYYYLNRTSFSGKLMSAAWGYREKRSLPPSRWHERIDPCGDKLQNVKITNMDFRKVIKEKSSEKVFMFIDPPYFSPAKRKHYRFGLDEKDHIDLSALLRVSDHSFVLTYDDCKEVRSLYKWANIYPISFFYRVDNSNIQNGKRRSGCELVISNIKFAHRELASPKTK